MTPQLVVIARLLRPRGIKGELAALPLSDHPERFDRLQTVLVNGSEYAVEHTWWHGGRLILKFRGIDTMTAAEPLAGADVCVPVSERVALPADEFYLEDLVGCTVVDRSSGATIGTVVGWQECGGAPLLEIRAEASGEEILIPFARSICAEIDPGARRIVIDPPAGLLALNK